MSFIPWSFYTGQEILVIRESGKTRERGLYSYTEQSIEKIPGRITINKARKTPDRQANFGEVIKQTALCTTPPEYPLTIDLEDKKADIVYFQERFWKVISSNVFKQLIPHSEAIAEHMTLVSDDLKALIPQLQEL